MFVFISIVTDKISERIARYTSVQLPFGKCQGLRILADAGRGIERKQIKVE